MFGGTILIVLLFSSFSLHSELILGGDSDFELGLETEAVSV